MHLSRTSIFAALPFLVLACSSAGTVPADTDGGPPVDGGVVPGSDGAVPGADASAVTDAAPVPVGPGGKLDTAFGASGNGIAKMQPQSFDFTPTTGLVLRDDRILTIGSGKDAIAKADVVIGRFTADGKDDAPMGSNASVKYTRTGPYDVVPVGAIELTGGRVAYYGQASSGTNGGVKNGFLELHRPADGACDGFRNSLCWAIPNPTYLEYSPSGLGAVHPTAAGDFLVGGLVSPSASNFALMKLGAGGFEDTTFGEPPAGIGFTATDLGGNDGISLLDVDTQGRIVAYGGTSNPSKPGVAMARYSASGVLDTTFGDNGKALLGVPSERFVRLANGNVLGAFRDTTTRGTGFVRITPAGTLDATFGTNGVVMAVGPAASRLVTALVVQTNGTILVGYDDFTVGRFSAAGVADATFGAGGFVTIPAVDLGPDAGLYALGVQSTGKIVAMGGQRKTGNMDRYMLVARLLP